MNETNENNLMLPLCLLQVDLHAATSKARARSMQQIKHGKIKRAAAYHSSLARRSQLPRFLRMLDLRLRAGLADMAAASVAAVVDVLRSAAPAFAGSEAAEVGTGSSNTEAPSTSRSAPSCSATSQRLPAGPIFFCSVVLADGGGVGFQPSEAEWTFAVEAEVVAASLHMADSVPALLSLPAFERYDTLPADQENGDGARQLLRAADLAQLHPVFAAATAELQSMLAGSFAAARDLVQQYQKYHDIHCFGAVFDFEEWAAKQRCDRAWGNQLGLSRGAATAHNALGGLLPAISTWCTPHLRSPHHPDAFLRLHALTLPHREALDLPAADALLSCLRSWQEELEAMPLSSTAGLLHVDAAGVKEQLAPIVATAQEQILGLLLRRAVELCREALSELAVWREVAGARPLDIEGFLPWSLQLEVLQVRRGMYNTQLCVSRECNSAAAAEPAELHLKFEATSAPAAFQCPRAHFNF